MVPPHYCSRLVAVRASTSAKHVELDAAIGGRAVLSTASGYRRLLTVTAMVLDQFAEPWDRVSAEAGLDRPSQLLRSALYADLGLIPVPEPASSSPSNGVRSLAFAAGVGYALEGSALGATTILRRLERGDGRDLPRSYYDTLACFAKTRWPPFCRWLDDTDLDDGAVAEGAGAVFDAALLGVRSADQHPAEVRSA